jgi:hypothetical protein
MMAALQAAGSGSNRLQDSAFPPTRGEALRRLAVVQPKLRRLQRPVSA